MEVPSAIFERNSLPYNRAFVPTTSHKFLTESEWNTIMSLLKILSSLEVAIMVLAGVQYPSFGCTFVVFHCIIQMLNDFVKSVTIPSHASLASSLKTFVLQRKKELEEHNCTLSFLSMSIDLRFMLAYIQDAEKKEQIKKELSDCITITYPDSLTCISNRDKRKRVQNISLHEFLPSARTTDGPNKTLDDELTIWFSSSTIFLREDDDAFSWWAKNCNHFR
jgi:hypothetical protein